jgi:hypothetical protein
MVFLAHSNIQGVGSKDNTERGGERVIANVLEIVLSLP